jgi:hypothetical protein
LESLDPGEDVTGEPELANSHDSYRQVWTGLTAMAQTFISHGWSYPGRHTALWHTADVLRQRGLTQEATTRALWMGARECRPKLGWLDVTYALGRAYQQKEG